MTVYTSLAKMVWENILNCDELKHYNGHTSV